MMANRSVRRVLVIAYYLVLFALYPLVQGVFWETALFFVLLFASPATAAGTEMLKALNDPEARADERQKGIINETMRKTYVVLAVMLLVPAFMLGFTDDLPTRVGEAVDGYLSYLFSFRILFLLISTLPPAVLMWLEPDPVPETEEPVENVRGGAQ